VSLSSRPTRPETNDTLSELLSAPGWANPSATHLTDGKDSQPGPVNAPTQSAELTVEVLDAASLSTSQRDAWSDLERRAVSANPFLSPQFVLPAWKHLTPHNPPVLIVMRRQGVWLGLGLFEAVAPKPALPIPHLRHWRTAHTFSQGLLLDAGTYSDTLAAFWRFLQRGRHIWHALELPQLAHDAAYFEPLFRSAAAHGVEALQGSVQTRACLYVDGDSDWDARTGMSPRRKRSVRQAWNWLQRQGTCEFRVQTDPSRLESSARRFLELESLGWKSSQQTALLSTRANRRFFAEMVDGFAAQERLFFTELMLDDQIIGSVLHLRSGATACAFKLGWDPAFARGCPGFQLKVQLAAQIEKLPAGLAVIDSCASPGSFIEHVWAGRRDYSSGVFYTSRAAAVAGTVVNTLRQIRDRGRQWLQTAAAEELA
jgi:CelD/BcsL family acetyltransferase involved in cellulose biosynthesis